MDHMEILVELKVFFLGYTRLVTYYQLCTTTPYEQIKNLQYLAEKVHRVLFATLQAFRTWSKTIPIL